ncbi:3'-5' exoribonuclease 1 [Elysia marginata]|uniref:3'-5' exoribonuclease 1 n=1 Tax=Elysia marginata TaxID=1093978 RepID=A0AAV4FYT1_9GAST|nr:3'-5' exoribonuclease 1 [Elysia marginata]
MNEGQSQDISSGWSLAAMDFLGLTSSKQAETSPVSQENTGPVRARPKQRLDGASGLSTEAEVSLKLSRINGSINEMTKQQIQDKLASIGLNTCGVKDVLKKRLKNYYKRQKSAQCNRALTEDELLQFDYLVVIDFEATCSETNDNFVHEIIEFPAVLVDAKGQVLGEEFQRFCRPKLNPKLTPFCTELTGITQSQVDRAQDFPEVLLEFEEWMASHKLGTQYKFAVLTDGPWDMARFLKTQTEISEVQFPSWARHWINLRKAYTTFYRCGKVNLQHMLQELGMTFEGRPHCGLDDSRNIAAIAAHLLRDGCIMRVNEHIRDVRPAVLSGARGGKGGGGRISSSKSRLTQKQSQAGGERQATDRRRQHGEVVDIPQEGENLEDLLAYLKLQRS